MVYILNIHVIIICLISKIKKNFKNIVNNNTQYITHFIDNIINNKKIVTYQKSKKFANFLIHSQNIINNNT
jgi:translation initiation factor 2B subunit (eIF-2B alpha/beta/delta family)